MWLSLWWVRSAVMVGPRTLQCQLTLPEQGRVCVDRSMLVCVALPQSHIEELMRNVRGRKYVSRPTGFITCSMILIQATAVEWPTQKQCAWTYRVAEVCSSDNTLLMLRPYCVAPGDFHDFLSNLYLNAPCSPLCCIFVQSGYLWWSRLRNHSST